MFEENQGTGPGGISENPPQTPFSQSQEPQDIFKEEVHSMPEKFITKEPKGGKKNVVIIVIIIIFILAALGLGGVILFNRLSKTTNANENVNVVITNLNTNANLNKNANKNLNANLNLNTNANANANANLSINTNLNTNVNLNANTNANTNANQNLNMNLNLNTNTILPSSTDSDLDGLTDVEETLYGTKANTPDTDGDGYIDGKKVQTDGTIIGEVYLGYDPTSSGKKLADSNLVKLYTNPTYNYSILYPAKWLASQTNTTTQDQSITFYPDTSTGEFIQVLVQNNPTRLSAKNWYLSLNSGVDSNEIESIVINGLEGVKSLDGSTIYLAKTDKIYVISYNAGGVTSLNYATTFGMMYQSFKLISSATNSNINSNTNS